MIVLLHIDGNMGLGTNCYKNSAQTLALNFQTESVYGQRYRFFVVFIAIIQLYYCPATILAGKPKMSWNTKTF